jgi:hypothetical protein
MRRGPQFLHDLDLLFGAAAAIVEILVEPLKLDLVPTDPDPEPEAATRKHVEAGRLLGDEHRLALRQDQHPGRKAELLGAARQIAEQYKRVVVKPAPGATGFRGALFTGAEHMVRRLDKMVTDRLRRLRVFAHNRGLAADVAPRQ